MNVLLEISNTDVIICSIIAFLVAVFYMISGLNILIKKNPSLISTKKKFKNEKVYLLITGILEIFLSVSTLALTIIALVIRADFLTYIIIAASIVLMGIFAEIILQQAFKE